MGRDSLGNTKQTLIGVILAFHFIYDHFDTNMQFCAHVDMMPYESQIVISQSHSLTGEC